MVSSGNDEEHEERKKNPDDRRRDLIADSGLKKMKQLVSKSITKAYLRKVTS